MRDVSASDRAHMAEAARISRDHMNAGAGGPFGATVVKDGAVIGTGWNQVTTASDPTAHAEVMAIRDACARIGSHDLSGAVIYASCEPCPMCLAAIYWARLDGIYYANTRDDAARIGFDDAEIYNEVGKAIEDRKIPMIRLEDEEAARAFAEWQTKEDKVPY